MGVAPGADEGKFSMTLRLKDGSIGDIRLNFPAGKDCTMVNDKIRCEWNAVIPLPDLNWTEKRRSTVSLMRKTGELRTVLETWGYDGKLVTGTPRGSLKLIRTGICRVIGKPIF
jgi:hypothetical protein